MAASQILPFAQLLRRYRRERSLTQEALAEVAGLSARGIRALEAGERSNPHKDTVRLLADALALSSDQRVVFEQAAAVAVSGTPQAGSAPSIGGFLGAVPAGPIIARQAEVLQLLGVLDRVAGGVGRLIMLTGEPGVGKTRLAQEVALAARMRGFLVASGRCYQPEQSVPYYPFLEALAVVYDGAPASICADVPRRWSYLEWLLPDRPQALGASEAGGQDVQQRLFWAVSGFLQAVAAAAPVALLLDDVHWADESSLKLLQYVARQTRGNRVLLLGTYRDVEVGRQHPLERTLRDLHREGLLEEITVSRLDQQGTAALAAALLGEEEVSEDFAQLVHEHTDGNPFFTQEVMRALVERGDVFFRDGSWDRRAVEEIEVPRSIRSAIGERVSRLSDQAQEVLHEASVLGQAFGFDDLWRMSQRSEEEVEKALEDALAAMLIRATGRDDYAFNHALTQQTLYAELPPRRRKRLNGAVGEALEQLPESSRRERAAQIAWHFLQAGSTDRALPFIMLAGDEAEAVFAHTEAEQHCRTALHLARELGDRPHEAEALQRLGLVLRMAGRYDEALEVLERAAEMCWTFGDIEGEARATEQIGHVHYHRGTPHAGYARVQAVVERLELLPEARRPQSALADLYFRLAAQLYITGRYTEVLAAGERAAQLARAAGNERSLAISGWARGSPLSMMGQWGEARRVYEETLPTFKAMGDAWWLAQPIGNIARTYVHQGDLERGRQYWERAVELLEAAHDPAEVAWASCYLGDVSFIVGDWNHARQQYERAAGLARSADSARYLSHALLHLADLSAIQGKGEEALRYVDKAIRVAERVGDVPALRTAQRLLAERDLAEGHPEAALDRLQPLLDRLGGEEPHAFPPPVLAEAYLSAGNMDRAHAVVEQRVRRFKEQDHKRALAVWLRVQSMVLGQQRRWEEADGVLAKAVSLAQAMPYPYAEARARYEHGRMLTERAEVQPAREQLEQALVIFQRLGAKNDVEKTEQMLAQLC